MSSRTSSRTSRNGPAIRLMNRCMSRRVLGVAALLAALVIALLPLPVTTSRASAADGEESAVTLSGGKGRYDDFSALKVTVHQTKKLRAQGVRVTWTGGAPTTDTEFTSNYLQIMQCWGDGQNGPDRENCEFGASGIGGTGGRWASQRALPDQVDPGEKTYVLDPAHPFDNPFVPFRPVKGKPTKSSTDFTYFGPIDTNEQPFVRVGADGTGESVFEAQTVVQAPHLGCGDATAAGPRHCWLVVVPRGAHDADGTTANAGDKIDSSGLSTTSWEQRLVFRLDFLATGSYCPIGQPESRTIGSEMVTDALTSWQPTLCQSTGTTFGFSQSGEPYARRQVTATAADAPGLAFTLDPVEAAEGGPPVVHAPVAVSGLTLGFYIETPGSGELQEMRLTPRLVAKMLTHSYIRDVPGWQLAQPPAHVAKNPASLRNDPEFIALNPQYKNWAVDAARPLSLLVPLDESDTARLVWQWLRSDPEARDFLAGKPDPWGAKINPYFGSLTLDKDTGLTDFPKSDPTLSPALSVPPNDPLQYGITDLDPYTQDMHDSAQRTRRGNTGRTIVAELDSNAHKAKLVSQASKPGDRAVIALVDSASAARYGLRTAALRTADGTFVKPTNDALAKGVGTMRPSAVPGVLTPDPASARGGAYPLTTVTYAAASTGRPAADRAAYSRLMRYAAGPGQTPGVSAGQLPPGYAPMPQALRTQALAAATALEKAKDPSGADGGTTAGAGAAGGAHGSSSGGSGGATTGGPGGGTGGTSGGPPASATPPVNPAKHIDPQKQSVVRATGSTPGAVLGAIRWVLLAVLVAGGGSALAGPAMLKWGVWRRRS
ncbi:hypothetical protein [Streptomyces sp. RKAG293]|uniref:hypothetical protein n=1 Tax=Streptomyces sp. RKAG293 TaxID=2893403 RepID=UPI0020339A18|nr:hypothetical protein [Streptomyces sp. RKAG293]MCM2421250.1 hypothetical protein [Streptomyces sp. RKAG293]